jgi:hypothetical protein
VPLQDTRQRNAEHMHRGIDGVIAGGYFKNVLDGCANDEFVMRVLA